LSSVNPREEPGALAQLSLLKLAPLQAKLFDRARNRAHANKLDRALSEVEMLLASAPGALAWFLLVAFIRSAYKLTSRYDRLRRRGMLTTRAVAAKFGIAKTTVHEWGCQVLPLLPRERVQVLGCRGTGTPPSRADNLCWRFTIIILSYKRLPIRRSRLVKTPE
jgi:hypothetical protein